MNARSAPLSPPSARRRGVTTLAALAMAAAVMLGATGCGDD